MDITAAINLNGAGMIESAASSTSQHHQHITAERLSTGHYQIQGVSGLASTGWRTSIPSDDNGQPLFSIDVTEEASALSVRVLAQNVPTDIATGRVLTLRMDATEPPMPEEPTDALEA